MTHVAVLDYGAGNLHSLVKALACDGVTVRVESDPAAALEADLLVLPGVGAFEAAAERLAPARAHLRDAILGGLPTLGICLGMQLLFDSSEEGGGTVGGLGVVPGRVRRLRGRRVPHMGWNTVEPVAALATALPAPVPPVAYFANSYVCVPDDPRVIAAYAAAGDDRFTAAVCVARTVGVQFHPEKSSAEGVRFVRAVVQAACGLAPSGAVGSAAP